MSSPMLHRDFLEPLERKALFFLQQKNLPLENMSPEKARLFLSEILFQHLEVPQLYRRYLAGAFIFEVLPVPVQMQKAQASAPALEDHSQESTAAQKSLPAPSALKQENFQKDYEKLFSKKR